MAIDSALETSLRRRFAVCPDYRPLVRIRTYLIRVPLSNWVMKGALRSNGASYAHGRTNEKNRCQGHGHPGLRNVIS